MKLSNKILIAFFSLAFIYLNAAFMEIRLRGTNNLLEDDNSIAETVYITGYNYLILPKFNHTIHVVGSDTSRIEVRSLNGDLLQELTYEKTGDVLSLESLNVDEDVSIRITVYVPKSSFRGMTVNGGNVTITGLDQEVLDITQTAGLIKIDGQTRLEKLHLESTSAYFNISEAHIDTLSLVLENAEVAVTPPVSCLKGSTTGASVVRLSEVEFIDFQKGEESWLIIQ
jgi:hypothetical protein